MLVEQRRPAPWLIGKPSISSIRQEQNIDIYPATVYAQKFILPGLISFLERRLWIWSVINQYCYLFIYFNFKSEVL